MTYRPFHAGAVPAIFGQEGELVLLRVAVEPRLLEDLLEALARLDFPVNPQLYHRPSQVIQLNFPRTHPEWMRCARHFGAMASAQPTWTWREDSS